MEEGPLADRKPRPPSFHENEKSDIVNPPSSTPRVRHKQIGEILLAEGLITQEQLEEALEHKKKSGLKLGQALAALEFVTHGQLASALEHQGKIQCINLTKNIVDQGVALRMGEERSRNLQAVAINRIAGTVTVAMEDPADVYVLDELTRALDARILAVHAEPEDIAEVLAYIFSGKLSMPETSKAPKLELRSKAALIPPTPLESLDQIATTAKEDISVAAENEPAVSIEEVTNEDNPVIKVVQRIFEEAYDAGASDIHIEPAEKKLTVRFRVDGVLFERTTLPIDWARSIIARLKVMAQLDISQRRLPQDGRIKIELHGNKTDVRLATTPTLFGEGAVCRILSGEDESLTLGSIGFEESQLEIIKNCAMAKDGMFLVTGPTGSGKTTTLYAVLSHLNSPDAKIITLEDPVENQLDGATQINCNAKIGLTFATGLRSILRQDPDTLLVGEIRDEETASIAVQAALTGHLVLSTLHTVGTAETITRLTEMGIEGYLLADTIRGIIAQRLVRRVCKDCKTAYTPEDSILNRVELNGAEPIFYKGKGCETCNGTGYKGRLGVYEIMAVDANVASAIRKGERSDIIQEAAQGSGMLTLRQDGVRKVLAGLTTITEILAVTPRG